MTISRGFLGDPFGVRKSDFPRGKLPWIRHGQNDRSYRRDFADRPSVTGTLVKTYGPPMAAVCSPGPPALIPGNRPAVAVSLSPVAACCLIEPAEMWREISENPFSFTCPIKIQIFQMSLPPSTRLPVLNVRRTFVKTPSRISLKPTRSDAFK